MSWVRFNGIDSRDYGVIIEQMPNGVRATKRTTKETPYGVHGSIIYDEGSYDSYEEQIVINCFGCDPRTIFKWLNGAGWLTTSDEPDKKRWVNFYDAASSKRLRRGAIYDSITAKMSCEPFCYSDGDLSIIVHSGSSIPGQGDAVSDPVLTVTGSGSSKITINNKSVYIDGLKRKTTLTIDCEAKQAIVTASDGTTQRAYFAGVDITVESEDEDDANRWITLNHDSSNNVSITGNITVSIDPKWRWF